MNILWIGCLIGIGLIISPLILWLLFWFSTVMLLLTCAALYGLTEFINNIIHFGRRE